MSATPAAAEGATEARPLRRYDFVLDAEDRITFVPYGPTGRLSPFVGHSIWGLFPGAEPLLRDRFDEARSTGHEVEFTVFYAGRTESIRALPIEDGLAVQVEQLTELDVRSLSTLAESLLRIEAELAARESEPHGPPTLSSPPALP